MHFISEDKLKAVIDAPSKSNPIPVEDTETLNTKKSQIETFLAGVFNDDTYSEPDTVDVNCRRISSLDCRMNLWKIYCQIASNTQLELPSLDYFIKVWNKSFPHLSNEVFIS